MDPDVAKLDVLVSKAYKRRMSKVGLLDYEVEMAMDLITKLERVGIRGYKVFINMRGDWDLLGPSL